MGLRQRMDDLDRRIGADVGWQERWDRKGGPGALARILALHPFRAAAAYIVLAVLPIPAAVAGGAWGQFAVRVAVLFLGTLSIVAGSRFMRREHDAWFRRAGPSNDQSPPRASG